VIEWPEHFKRGVDKDSPDDMKWLCEHAQLRAAKYGIKGVDYKLTMGVIKNIIPAIASTNALVAAACVNECIKILTGCNYRLKNVSYNFGQTRMNITQHEDAPNPDCLVCSKKSTKQFTVRNDETLQEFIDKITQEFKLQGPTLTYGNSVLCSKGF
jgi:ubiquitin-activating enzyme E1 C